MSQDMVNYMTMEGLTFYEYGASYTWASVLALKFLVTFMTCVFQVGFTVRIRISLRRSIKFLVENSSGLQGARRYQKIIRFSVVLCVIMVFYNFAVQGVITGKEIHRQLIAYFLIDYRILENLGAMRALEITDRVMYMINCLKPCLVGLTYIWVKCW